MNWRKSTHSGLGNCVEVGWRTASACGQANCVEVGIARPWHKSSYSGTNGNCVEVSERGTVVLVRDTKDRDRGALAFSPGTWTAFLGALKAGEIA